MLRLGMDPPGSRIGRLDGIPLAIELAAARVRLLSPAQISSRLDDAFRLLTGGSRSVLPRHQTLRALIDWSYDLLSAKERTLFRRLSVFSGSWSLEGAEAVCSFPPSGSNPASAIEDLSRDFDRLWASAYYSPQN